MRIVLIWEWPMRMCFIAGDYILMVKNKPNLVHLFVTSKEIFITIARYCYWYTNETKARKIRPFSLHGQLPENEKKKKQLYILTRRLIYLKKNRFTWV